MALFTWRRTADQTSLPSRGHHLPRRSWRLEELEDRSLMAGDLLSGAAGGGSPLGTDPVILWNRVALAAHVVDMTPGILPGSNALAQAGPTRESRALGMVQGAVFDAVNSIDHSYTPYLLTQTFSSTASEPAAVAVAAHDTLVSLFPKQKVSLDVALGLYLALIPNGAAENEGVRAGHAAAAAMLAARQNDGSNAPMSYTPGDQPGDHRPDPLHPDQGFLTPQWGDVTPFTLNAGGGTDAFLSPPPPDLTSAAYAAAFNEVKAVGAVDAETADRNGDGQPDRTPEQTMIGIYWAYDGSPGLGTPPRLYNQIAETVAIQQHNTLVQNARMFALVNLALADSGIQAWDTKYTYNFWRPILGIREADPGTGPTGLGDGNPATAGETDWQPLGGQATNSPPGSTNFTPNFPSYTSGHATFGAALFETLARFYGRDDISFTFVSDEFNGHNRDANGQVRPLIPRTFTSFSQAAEENGQSRIYLGIHWAFDKTEGIAAGDRIADFVFSNFLRPRHQSGILPADSGGTGQTLAAPVPAAPATAVSAPATQTVMVANSGDSAAATLTSAATPATQPAQPATLVVATQVDSDPVSAEGELQFGLNLA